MSEQRESGPIDEILFRELYGNDPEFEQVVFRAFLESAPGLMESIEDAGGRSDLTGLLRKAHNLSKLSASLGVLHVWSAASRLEDAVRNGQVDAAREHIRETRVRLTEAVDCVRDRLGHQR